MTKQKHNYQNIEEFIAMSHPHLKPIIARLRKLFNEYSNDIEEQIKWNSPAFIYKHEISNYDPKSYIKDFVVFNTNKDDYLLLVFPNGAKISGNHNVFDGKFKDNRESIKIHSLDDLNSKELGIRSIVSAYINDLKSIRSN